jgi:CBS domain-containing protein
MKVKDMMHMGVDWVSPNTPVTELAKLMREHDIGCIPIGEDDRLIGMVTDRDIVCKGLASNNFDAGRAMARDVMTEGIHCCREDDDLAKAVHHMEKLKLRRLPVISKSKRVNRRRGQIAAGAGSNAIKTIEKKPIGVGSRSAPTVTPLRRRFRYLSQGVTAVASRGFVQRRFTSQVWMHAVVSPRVGVRTCRKSDRHRWTQFEALAEPSAHVGVEAPNAWFEFE